MQVASAIFLCGLLPATCFAADYSETISGDLSNNRLAPTLITLGTSSNHISGSVTLGDRDFFVARVPAGAALHAIILEQYSSSNGRAFIGFQAGSTFAVDPDSASPGDLLGYAHYGFDTPVGLDLLPLLDAPDAIGFATPLPAGDYTFWLNQTEPALTGYGFNFVVPEPASISFIVAAAVVLRRQCRSGIGK